MPRDVIVWVDTDAKPLAPENMDVLLISTEGAKPYKVYKDIEEVGEDFADISRVYQQAKRIYEQVNSMSGYMVRDLAIVGVNAPTTPADLITEIENLQQSHRDWYCFMTDQESDDYIVALSAWAMATEPTLAQMRAGVEDFRKIYFAQTTNKTLKITTGRTVLVYTDPDKATEEAAAAWFGNVAPYYPFNVTWKFKTLDGVTPSALGMADKDRLDEANINYYTTENKYDYMKNGICADGEWIDVLLGKDYLTKVIRDEFYKILVGNPNIPYTDTGFTICAQAVQNGMAAGVEKHIVARDPATGLPMYEMKIPRWVDSTKEQRFNRMMPPIPWKAQLEGAIHAVETEGVLAVQL